MHIAAAGERSARCRTIVTYLRSLVNDSDPLVKVWHEPHALGNMDNVSVLRETLARAYRELNMVKINTEYAIMNGHAITMNRTAASARLKDAELLVRTLLAAIKCATPPSAHTPTGSPARRRARRALATYCAEDGGALVECGEVACTFLRRGAPAALRTTAAQAKPGAPRRVIHRADAVGSADADINHVVQAGEAMMQLVVAEDQEQQRAMTTRMCAELEKACAVWHGKVA